MSEIKTITWRDLTGNKYLKALHPAMLSEGKFIATQRIRRIGQTEPDIFRTVYDREYAINFLTRKLCKPFAFIGEERILELVAEAWALYAQDSRPSYAEEED